MSPQPIDWDDAMMLLERLRDKGEDNTRLMLACGFYFGLRISDILRLRWKDIMGDSFEIQEQKNKKHRSIKLNDGFKEVRDQIVDNGVFAAG